MITGDHDRLQNIAKFNVCAEHHTPLEVAWLGAEKCWVLRCDEGTHKKTAYAGKEKVEVPNMLHPGHYPDAVTRQLSLTQLHKAGEELPSFIEDNIKKSQRRRTMQEDKGKPGTQFALVPLTDLGTGVLLVTETIKALVDYAHKYHLDPERGHVVLMYSKPYITIDGYLYHARQTNVPYTLESRPLSREELKEFIAPQNAHVWISKVILTDTGDEFVGYGVVTREEIEAKSPRDANKLRSPVVAAHPQLLAQKRADWQALRRAFPIGEEQDVSTT